MGNSCCAKPKEDDQLLTSYCENMDDSKTRVVLCERVEIKQAPELFVLIKKGDIYSYYHIGKMLGQGAYGTVTLVTYKKTGMVRAMKTIKKKALFEEDHERFFAEMHILKDLDHPNIVSLYELYQDDINYYLITEYLEGGEMLDRIMKFKTFNEGDAAKLMRQIMSAIAYCHSKNIVHRDIKPENIIFNSLEGQNLKVIDFGTSRKLNKDQKMTKKLGTPYYIAPEVLAQDYGLKCDIWSCGVILYILLAGYPPFNGRSENEIYKKIQLGKVRFDQNDWRNISPEAQDLIKKMLTTEVSFRLSAEEVLNHVWIQRNQDQSLINLNIIQNLQAFTAQGKFKHFLLTFMATQMMNQQDQEELQIAFRQCDKNGDGMLSKEELVEAFTKSMQESGKMVDSIDQKIMKIIETVDINQTGFINFTEFIVASVEQEKILSEQRIRQAFDIIDQDENEYISREELQQIMEGMDDDVWVQFLKECDKDNDGRISREEFTQILMSKVQQDQIK